MKSSNVTGALAAIALTAFSATSDARAADPSINFTFPSHVYLAGGVQKIVSGNLLEKVTNSDDRIVKLRLTCAFAEALDANNQKFCNTPDKLPGIYKALRHYAVSHRTCRKQFGQVETSARRMAGDTNIARDVNRLAGSGWENASYCPLIDARDRLMDEYRKMDMTAE